jgi:hypothetical protein
VKVAPISSARLPGRQLLHRRNQPWDGKAAKDPAAKVLITDGVARADKEANDRHKVPYAVQWETDRVVLLQRIETTDFFQKVRGDLIVSSITRRSSGRSSATRAPPPSMAATSSAASPTSTGSRRLNAAVNEQQGGIQHGKIRFE